MQHDVFLSYSFKDLRVVRRLYDALSACGIRCWPDRILTPGTERWRAHVHEAIANSACVVVALSKDTIWSAWVEIALALAVELNVPVIPVLVNDSPGHILLVELDGQEWFDLRFRKGYYQEIAQLAALIREYAAQRMVEAV